MTSGKKLYVRPHLGLLPTRLRRATARFFPQSRVEAKRRRKERENRSPVSCIAQSSCLSLFIQHEELTNGRNPTDSRAIKNSRLPFPLPGEEGQGEGERNR